MAITATTVESEVAYFRGMATQLEQQDTLVVSLRTSSTER